MYFWIMLFWALGADSWTYDFVCNVERVADDTLKMKFSSRIPILMFFESGVTKLMTAKEWGSVLQLTKKDWLLLPKNPRKQDLMTQLQVKPAVTKDELDSLTKKDLEKMAHDMGLNLEAHSVLTREELTNGILDHRVEPKNLPSADVLSKLSDFISRRNILWSPKKPLFLCYARKAVVCQC